MILGATTRKRYLRYFITFACYGARLHGEESGSVDRQHNLVGSRLLEPDPQRVPSADAWVLRGGSCIIAPDGSFVHEPVYEKEAVIYGQIDLGRIAEESMTLDVTGHYSRPDCFRLLRVASS